MSAWRTAPAPPERVADAEHGAGLLRRPEVRDVLAWLRLLADPHDAAAVVRALARPPVELRQVDLARVIQIARRRKLDLVVGLTAATESPQVPPEARERIQRFANLHRGATSDLETMAPDAFLARLIERLGTPGRPLLSPAEADAQRTSLELLRKLAEQFVQRSPDAGVAALAKHLAAVRDDALEPPLPIAPIDETGADTAQTPAGRGVPAAHERTRQGQAQPEGAGAEDPPPQAEQELQAMLHLLREEVIASVARIGGSLGELRLDTDLDISHGVVRYLELLKLSALLQRPQEQGLAEALADVNARLLAAVTPLQREILQTSTLDDALLDAAGDARSRAQALAPRGEPSLQPFLPRRGMGLALSASDIETYRSCPLRYKFGRVLRIPTGQTPNQRFGIVVHQVLERYHSEGGGSLERMLALLDRGWRRAGLDERDERLRERARRALRRYHARLLEEPSEPLWFERQFDFRLGPHHVRGRVDRIDRVGAEDGERYELIDYKTSRPKTAAQLRDDVQLTLYALAAREAWQLECSSEAYYYVLDDVKVPVPHGHDEQESVRDVVLEVGEGILAQAFEPTPSARVCSMCEYRIVCPAAET